MTSPVNNNVCRATGARSASGIRTRVLFVLAGAATLLGVLLSAVVSRWFLLIPTLVGANQLLMAATGWCPMSLLLDRLRIGTDSPTFTGLASTI
jgi:Protein of unknown function (DUF2892)